MELLTQELIDQHEAFKMKGLQLSDDDLFNRIWLQDLMLTKASNMKAKYLEDKLVIDKDKALRTLELKNEKDEDWKKPTERWIEAMIKKEFHEKDLNQLVAKATYELLLQKASTITEFVNVVKMNKKASFSM